MSDDWIWNGEPEDPSDRKLVAALRTLDRERGLPPLPERPAPRPPRWRRPAAMALAVALMVAVVVGPAWWMSRERWALDVLAGASPCPVGPCGLGPGDSVSTARDGAIDVTFAGGSVRMAGGTTITRAEGSGPRLRLDEGSIEVEATTAPGELVVETPYARVVDLGCAFAVVVGEGRTHLAVADGSVALENDQGVSVVTAGSVAEARPGARPSLPVRGDASPAFVSAAQALDAGAPWSTALDDLLAAARPEDLLTLWHVLQLVPPPERGRVLATVRQQAPGVTVDEAGVGALQDDALRGLWTELTPVALGR